MNLLISQCFLGCPCRYDGNSNLLPQLSLLREKYTLIPVCPEILGGLPTPRTPAEHQGDRVVSKDGADVTEAFSRGAREALRVALLTGCTVALLKERSPSCGFGAVYDGTFSGTLIEGSGTAAKLLSENGVRIFGETQISELLRP